MTKVSMPIIGWVSEILGWMINVIYSGLELIGITNIGLVHYFIYTGCISSDDSVADQTAEIFQVKCCYAA